LRVIEADITNSGGWISFAHYMELALYAPGLGYYMAGARKLGRDGDFVTAPEVSRLFGRTLARQVNQLAQAGLTDVLEIGAGSGALAADLLLELERLGTLPGRYWILELSPDLRERSRDTLAARAPHLLERVAWLNGLPPSFEGIVIGNEVLDAMPANVYRRVGGNIVEMGVVFNDGKPGWSPAPPGASAPRSIPRGSRRKATAAKCNSIRRGSSAAWVHFSSAASRYFSITAFRAASTTTRSARAAR